NQRKIITLPVTLAGLEPGDAYFQDKWLHIPFDLDNHKEHRRDARYERATS
ncbi:MAG: arsenic-transporting ATPase, partial [Chlorobiaceae bacterium]|nr:arsenic-transporting ATPase [Chlorobiaceae bacterium]NTV25332.1 arsenic-transporting ATPase [Chlorobiaceae bacterium]